MESPLIWSEPEVKIKLSLRYEKSGKIRFENSFQAKKCTNFFNCVLAGQFFLDITKKCDEVSFLSYSELDLKKTYL